MNEAEKRNLNEFFIAIEAFLAAMEKHHQMTIDEIVALKCLVAIFRTQSFK